jgi:hypothetical protein
VLPDWTPSSPCDTNEDRIEKRHSFISSLKGKPIFYQLLLLHFFVAEPTEISYPLSGKRRIRIGTRKDLLTCSEEKRYANNHIHIHPLFLDFACS